MTGILENLKWESLKKMRRDSRLILLYKGPKGAACIPTDDLIPQSAPPGAPFPSPPAPLPITYSALVEKKYSVSLKTLLQQSISEPEFYGDLVYRFRKIVSKSNFSEQFRKLINRYKRIGYSLDMMRQTACLVVNPIIVDGCASP